MTAWQCRSENWKRRRGWRKLAKGENISAENTKTSARHLAKMKNCSSLPGLPLESNMKAAASIAKAAIGGGMRRRNRSRWRKKAHSMQWRSMIVLKCGVKSERKPPVEKYSIMSMAWREKISVWRKQSSASINSENEMAALRKRRESLAGEMKKSAISLCDIYMAKKESLFCRLNDLDNQLVKSGGRRNQSGILKHNWNEMRK